MFATPQRMPERRPRGQEGARQVGAWEIGRRRFAGQARHLAALALRPDVRLLDLRELVLQFGDLVAHRDDDVAQRAVMIDGRHHHLPV
jgi:hypothetical protein